MKKRLALVTAAIVLVGLTMAARAYYSLKHFSIATPAQTDAMQVAIKGLMGEMIFGSSRAQTGPVSQGQGLDALFAHTTAAQGEGLISEYQKDPEKFRRYAQLFDTAVSANRIGKLVQKNRSAYKLPSSSSVVALADAERLDAWGHPYCIIPFRQGIAVVSGGPESQRFVCGKQRISAGELSSSTRNIFRTSSGEVVVLVGVARTDKNQQ